MKAQRMKAQGRDEDREFLDQLQRLQQQMLAPSDRGWASLNSNCPCELSVNRSNAGGGRKRKRHRASGPAGSLAGTEGTSCRPSSSALVPRGLCPLQPEPHIHLVVHPRGGGQVLVGLLALSG